MYILPETKGIPLEEMGKLFGDESETSMYSEEVDADDVARKQEVADADSEKGR